MRSVKRERERERERSDSLVRSFSEAISVLTKGVVTKVQRRKLHAQTSMAAKTPGAHKRRLLYKVLRMIN